MPEGDTIHRAANRLRPALSEQELTRFSVPRTVGDHPRLGETITGVRAIGKHLFIDFSGGLTLETHMLMVGSWHLYSTDERWHKGAHLARAEVGVRDWIAVCFSAPVVKIGPRERMGRADLGPDLCTPEADIAAAVERFMALAGALDVADALLDQRIGCGIGNVYKSEVLWAERMSPFRPAADIDSATADRLLRRAQRLLLANLNTNRRTTVPGGLAVYQRRGRPCRVCGTPIQTRKQGQHSRSTYWCPRCQGD